jgi:hypothetical protein
MAAERRHRERRRQTAWSFLYGGVRPRRRVGRRQIDGQSVLLDWHEPRILYLALAILLMSCVDAFFTLNLINAGAEEFNVFMRMLLDQDVRWFLWMKIGLTGASIIVLVATARRMLLGSVPVITLIEIFCATYVALICWELYLFGWRATSIGEDTLEYFSRWVAG